MKKVFFIAGDSSGDIHGAHLIRALLREAPELRCSGLGGKRMADAGMELVHDLAGQGIMGFVEVLKHALPIRRLFLDTVLRLKQDPPDALVLIDYPGFNIRFAAAVAELGFPIIYYISPQFWAWKRKRLYTLARLVRKMLVIFPFEEELYRDQGVDCVYVGHPLADELAANATGDFPRDPCMVGLFPGSRAQEIERIAPVMADVGRALLEQRPDLRFVTACVSDERAAQIQSIMGGLPLEIKVRGMREALARSWCCLVASGTATIETALMGTPMGIVYRVNPVSYRLARMLVTVRYIGMVNILAEREVVPEFIQHNATATRITPFLLELMGDSDVRHRMLLDLEEIRRRLGGSGASQRAAREILGVLERG